MMANVLQINMKHFEVGDVVKFKNRCIKCGGKVNWFKSFACIKDCLEYTVWSTDTDENGNQLVSLYEEQYEGRLILSKREIKYRPADELELVRKREQPTFKVPEPKFEINFFIPKRFQVGDKVRVKNGIKWSSRRNAIDGDFHGFFVCKGPIFGYSDTIFEILNIENNLYHLGATILEGFFKVENPGDLILVEQTTKQEKIMKLEIFKEKKEEENKVTVALVNYNGGIFWAVVDNWGRPEPRGFICEFTTRGTIRLCENINPKYGFKLDSRGRIEIE